MSVTRLGRWLSQIRVESFVSRDILDRTMGSNLPVLRHLAEEAAQQKSRHVGLVYGKIPAFAAEAPRTGGDGQARARVGTESCDVALDSRHGI